MGGGKGGGRVKGNRGGREGDKGYGGGKVDGVREGRKWEVVR